MVVNVLGRHLRVSTAVVVKMWLVGTRRVPVTVVVKLWVWGHLVPSKVANQHRAQS